MHIRFVAPLYLCIMMATPRSVGAKSPDTLSFSPSPGVIAKITHSKNEITVRITDPHHTLVQNITIDAEKKLTVATADFNFDGHADFSVSHIDEGMGTYTISYIYVFSHENRLFVPLKPKCGDEFINVRISIKDRSLRSSYFVDNQLKSCIIRY